MSLDNIQLPGFLQVSLFKNNLVDLRQDIQKNTINPEVKIDFLGGNERKITFVVNEIENKFLADAQMSFLNDLLNACHLTMADIALVNFYNSNTITYQDLILKTGAQKILIFGLTTKDLDLPFSIPFFQLQNFQEQVFLLCPPLQEIQQDKELKKRLWICLQNIFNIQKQK